MDVFIKITVLNTLFWLFLNFGIAYLIRFVPIRILEVFSLLDGNKLEKKIYSFIKIKDWKDNLPEMGGVFGFKKDKVEKLEIPYLHQFIKETYYAEAGHLLIAIFGFSLFLINGENNFAFSIICSVINATIHIPFILIQRHNRPRLRKILQKMERRNK